jgi:hypothetical protein
MQPFVAVIVLAAVIASRKTQMPVAPVSANEFTLIVAAYAVALTISAIAIATIGAPEAQHNRNLRQPFFVAIAARASNFAWMNPTLTKLTTVYQS